MSAPASAIILAGGRSTRLGEDKALLEFGGRPLLVHVAGTLSTVCDQVIIAGRWRKPEDWPVLEATWVADMEGVAGPLAGLRPGLEAVQNERCVVVACDMPFISAPLLAHLSAGLDGCDAVVPVVHGRAQPLHAAYSRSCLPTVDSLLRLGARSVQDLLARVRVSYVGEQQCAHYDPAGLSTFNMNSPEDVDFARRQWAHRNAGTAVA